MVLYGSGGSFAFGNFLTVSKDNSTESTFIESRMIEMFDSFPFLSIVSVTDSGGSFALGNFGGVSTWRLGVYFSGAGRILGQWRYKQYRRLLSAPGIFIVWFNGAIILVK